MHKTIPITETSDGQRRKFSCGVAKLDEYFHRYAKNNHSKNAGKTFVLVIDGAIVGYFTINMYSMAFNSLPFKYQASLPDPVPAALIGRLAVSSNEKVYLLGKKFTFPIMKLVGHHLIFLTPASDR